MSGLTPDAGTKTTCKHLMRDAADCVFCERDRLRQELEALKRTREQEKDYANTCYENERLRTCLVGIASCSTCEVCRGAAESTLRHAPQTAAYKRR